MTRDELITAIRTAGLTVGTNISGVTLVGSPSTPGIAHITLEEMARLADTLVAAERETKDALLRQAWAVIRWQCFGECRTEGVEGLPTPSEVDIAIRQHLKETK